MVSPINISSRFFYSFLVNYMVVPHGLIIIVGLLFVSFVIAYCYLTGQTRKEVAYQKLSSNGDDSCRPGNYNGGSYQNSADYALPTDQKVVTYCVIDGRLMDPLP
jgi:hypothetical protein